jgi:hypothetical protein
MSSTLSSARQGDRNMKSPRALARAPTYITGVAILTLVAAMPAAATTAVTPRIGELLTCQQMENNCLKFARRAVMAAGADADLPYNVSANACYDSFRQAKDTGVWPANPPFSFALKCTN